MPKTVKFGADPREEGVTGGPRTTPMTPERKEVLRKAEEENARNRAKSIGVKKAAGGKTEKGKTMKYSKGGLAAGHKSADGVAKKGKTKAMMPKMAKGGMTKKKAC
jgi:hypothetical protein